MRRGKRACQIKTYSFYCIHLEGTTGCMHARSGVELKGSRKKESGGHGEMEIWNMGKKGTTRGSTRSRGEGLMIKRLTAVGAGRGLFGQMALTDGASLPLFRCHTQLGATLGQA
jgi:hypothetical protein